MLSSREASKEAKNDVGLAHRVFEPEAGPSSRAAIVMVHGRAGNASSMWAFSRALRELDAVIVSPQGRVEDDSGFSWWPIEPSAALPPEIPKQRILAAVKNLEQFILALPKVYQVDPKRIAAFGFSQGAALVATLSLLNPKLLNGAALLSGFIPRVVTEHLKECRVEGSLPPFLVVHGKADQVVPFERAEQATALLENHRTSVELVVDNTGHKIGLKGMRALHGFLKRTVSQH